MNQKSLDKQKPKELDWEEKTYKFIKNILLDAEEKKVPHPVLISQIFSLLTQQRTELLEEILKIIEVNVHIGSGYTDECSKDDLKKLITNLLNKKNV